MAKEAVKPKQTTGTSPLGVIEPDALYTVQEARRRLQVGDWAWRQWRRDGLTVLRVSGRAFVMGSALIEFIHKHGQQVT
jgi:hypothetical protein